MLSVEWRCIKRKPSASSYWPSREVILTDILREKKREWRVNELLELVPGWCRFPH